MRCFRFFVLGCLFWAGMGLTVGEEISPQELARFKQFIPRTLVKLQKRSLEEDVRVAVVGDSISNFYQPLLVERYDLAKSWHRRFLNLLAGRFFYTGGVKETSPKVKQRVNVDDDDDAPRPTEALDESTGGPTIQVYNKARDGASSVQAFQAANEAFDEDPDLVLAMYGTNDVVVGTPFETFRKALEHLANACKERGVDFILAGPPLICQDNFRNFMGQTRPYASIAREVAEAAGALFIDMGAAQCRMAIGPDPTAEDCWERLLRHVRLQYEHRGLVDGLHPNALGHRIMGQATWSAMVGEDAAEEITATGSLTLPATAADAAVMEISLRRTQTSVTNFAISPLGADRVWMPREDLSEAELESGASPAITTHRLKQVRSLRFLCSRVPGSALSGSRTDLPTAQEDSVRTSFLLSEGGKTRLLDVNLLVLPAQILLPPGRIESCQGEFTLEAVVVNSSTLPFEGKVETRWRGKVESAPIRLEPAVRLPFPVKLALPTEGTYARHLLEMRLVSAAATYAFKREVECVQNVSLNQRIPLFRHDQVVVDAPGGFPVPDPATHPQVFCQADASGIYFSFDLPPLDGERSKDVPAALIELSLDGRGAEERGKTGYVGQVDLQVPWEVDASGSFPIRRLQTSLFGTPYDRTLEERFFPASLRTLSDGRRQVRLSIPRNYFYRHEWDLKGRGHFELGFNVRIALAEITADQPNPFPTHKRFFHTTPGLPQYDAWGLGVLELRDQPSGKWSVRIY